MGEQHVLLVDQAPHRSPHRQPRSERSRTRRPDRVAGDGAGRAGIGLLRPRGGADGARRYRRGGPRHHRRHHRDHRRAARDRLPVLLADHRRLSQQRRLLRRRQGQPRHGGRPPGSGGLDGRLPAQRRRRHLGRRRRADLCGRGAAALHAAALPRHPRDHHVDEPARYPRVGRGLGVADLHLRRHPRCRARPRLVSGVRGGWPPDGRRRAAASRRQRRRASRSGCCCAPLRADAPP